MRIYMYEHSINWNSTNYVLNSEGKASQKPVYNQTLIWIKKLNNAEKASPDKYWMAFCL